MFDGDYELTGIHATYAKFLKDDALLYDYIVDVYMNGAVFGLLYNRRSPKDNESSDKVRIFSDAFARRREKCIFLYRLVMLLEKKTASDTQARVDRAFRDDADESKAEEVKANLDLFHEYVRGGIEIMYERFIEGGHNKEDYLEKAMDFMAEFSQDVSGDSFEDKVAALIG